MKNVCCDRLPRTDGHQHVARPAAAAKYKHDAQASVFVRSTHSLARRACMNGVRRAFRRRHPRTGAALAAVMVCLLVVTLMAGVLLRTIVQQHRQTQLQQRQLQAYWLAESAAERAAGQLSATPDYTGETWRVEIDESSRVQNAVAEIRVTQDEPASDRRVVDIQVLYPDDPMQRVRYAKQIIVQLPQSKTVE